MAFTVPVFPLLCDIWTGPWLTRSLRHSGVACNLAWGKRGNIGLGSGYIVEDATHQIPMVLLLPKLTDIWDGSGLFGAVADLVECPAGSGRWYGVSNVDDIGKGFANEHRAAVLMKMYEAIDPTRLAGLAWPQPIP